MSKKPTIFVLGTAHFSNVDNGDMVQIETKDILSDHRQNEITGIIGSLKEFKPTKVAVEVVTELEERLNENYASYLAGNFSLASNEIHQIGFRLAKKCDLDKVHAVDWNESLDDVPSIGQLGENKSTVYDNFLETVQELGEKTAKNYEQLTLREFLLWLNGEENVSEGHKIYMKLALLGDDINPIGTKWTAYYWYYRNLLIYRHLVNLIDSNEERIFVLYGYGHLHLLLQFLKESGLVNVEVAKDYLSQ